MNEIQFKNQYVATFLSSYMASRYEDDCASGHWGEPYNHQPVEDAIFLANKAWYKLKELGLETIFNTPAV